MRGKVTVGAILLEARKGNGDSRARKNAIDSLLYTLSIIFDRNKPLLTGFYIPVVNRVNHWPEQ
jgi:hypothetical protein